MLTLTATIEEFENASTSSLKKITEMAIGRILKLGSRKCQDGDIEQYEKCKWIIMEATEILNARMEYKK